MKNNEKNEKMLSIIKVLHRNKIAQSNGNMLYGSLLIVSVFVRKTEDERLPFLIWNQIELPKNAK